MLLFAVATKREFGALWGFESRWIEDLALPLSLSLIEKDYKGTAELSPANGLTIIPVN